MESTALALVPKEQSIEFRRCTGHCCNPIVLKLSPGDIAGCKTIEDQEFIQESFIYLRWVPASQDKARWSHFEYQCRHFDRKARKCMIYGTGQRAKLCRRHPEYGGHPWKNCTHEGCTRRTMVIGGSYRLRWRFPDLWHLDRQYLSLYDDYYLFKVQFCEATTSPDSGCTEWER